MKQYIFSPIDESYKVAYLTNQLGTNNNISIYEIKSKVGSGDWTPGLCTLGQAAGLWDEYVELTLPQLVAKAVALDYHLKSYADRAAETEVNTKLANFLTFSTQVAEEEVVIDTVAKTVAITVPFGTTVTALQCIFTTNTLTSIKIGATAQVSGTTANNFTSAKTYRLMAADGVTFKDFVVTVTVAAE
jgi:hypothetical protein